ncbi:UNVERIFIED_CONTAM: hypothetical protein K0B97_03300 [Spiribacter pallidus]
MLWGAVTLSGIALIAALFVPVPLGTQAILAWGALGGLFLLGALRVRGALRLAIYAITVFVAGRYIVWRLVHTVPTEGTAGEVIPGLLLVSAEVYAFWLLLTSVFVLLDPIRRPSVTLAGCGEAARPRVDILIPTYDESPEVIEATVLAACNIDYPADRLTV